eukprot:COSAG01_NODE_2302_length_7952_cov_8.079078_2_plen_92_part_00
MGGGDGGSSKLVLAIRGGLNATLIDPSSTVCGCKGCDCLTASYSSDGGEKLGLATPRTPPAEKGPFTSTLPPSVCDVSLSLSLSMPPPALG